MDSRPAAEHSAAARLDTSALTEPLAASELPSPSRSTSARSMLALMFTFLAAGAGATWRFFPLDPDGGPRATLGWLAIGLVLAAFCFWLARAVAGKDRARNELRHRLSRFLATNRRTLLLDVPDPHVPGELFTQGAGRVATELVRWTAHGPAELANYRFAVRRGKASRVFNGGYLAVRTLAPLPDLFLEPARPKGVIRRQRLRPPTSFRPVPINSPEGRTYTLWSEPGQASDVAAALTPELLSLLGRRAADLEIVARTAVVYSASPLVTADPALWAWIDDIVAELQTHEPGERSHLMPE
ncbi:hypothetical protein [Arthrobacter sp. NPDC090010]|uniref:hypothetical protein n=1 Tax=Arthrobacter sp. NPDC090010 TaxID=3363942 RepID=UPI0038186A5E